MGGGPVGGVEAAHLLGGGSHNAVRKREAQLVVLLGRGTLKFIEMRISE